MSSTAPDGRFARHEDEIVEPTSGAAVITGSARSDLGVHPLAGLGEQTGAPPISLRRDAFYRRGLAVADLLAATVAVLVALVLLGGIRISPAGIVVLPVVIAVAKVVGLYDRDEHLIRKTTLEEAPALFQVATLYTLVIWLSENLLIGERGPVRELGAAEVVSLWALLFLCMLAARAFARALIRRVTDPERCLVLGTADAAASVRRKLGAARGVDTEVVGRVTMEWRMDDRGPPAILGDLSELERVIDLHRIERVIIAPARTDSDRLLEAIQHAKALGVKVSLLPRVFEVVGSSVRFDDVQGLTLLGVPRFGLSRSSYLVKRSVDLIGASLALTFLSPLLMLIAIAVKLDSPGPVLFRQRRIGRRAQEFEMVKFRTMEDGAEERKRDLLDLNEAKGLFKIANDPRLTRVGRVLRRFSLDELPQLLNVLRGDMSLVGPRPLVLDDDQQVLGWHRRRLDLLPGMTGIWQVLGSARIPLEEMVKIDYLYGANWSLWLDLRIMLRTIPYMVGRRGL